jgi:putative PIN family toxin of toxin-antitoxin system
MNIVLDTNVFVSGIFWTGPPSQVLSLWEQRKIILCLTPNILKEYQRVAHSLNKKYSAIDLEPILELLQIYALFYPDCALPSPVCRDPDDDKFIACAITAKAKIIISGDDDLLCLGNYEDIEILKPQIFLARQLH